MGPFWSTLVRELWESWTPILVLALLLVRSLAKRGPRVERYHIRAATTLVVGHVIAVVVAAGQTFTGYDTEIAEVTSMAFELLAVVSIATTALFRALLPRVGFILPRILIDLITFVAILVVFIVVGKRAGFSVAGLITTSAVLTAVIGFSLQDTLGNVMGGLSVQLDKSIGVGDWITVAPGGPSGRVTEIRWRYTAIETPRWETVIIPNGVLVKSQITIQGRRIGSPPYHRRAIEFFVDFRTPPSKVIEEVQSALRSDTVPNTATEPAPQVLFTGVRDSFAQYAIRYWLTDLNHDETTDSAVRVRMWFALRRAGIPLSIPASTLFLTHETPEREARKQADELSQRMTALGSVDLFRMLSAEVRADLAKELIFAPFANGEAITQEGDRDEGLYMIVRGQAVVRIGKGREEREVARLHAGQFFGEMSLMTGEARTASVIAASDMLCYRVDKPAFEQILQKTPTVAEQIAEVLATRRMALTQVRDERDEMARARRETAKKDLLGKITRFFGISQPPPS